MKPWGPFWLQESLKKSSRIDNFWGSSRGRNSRFFEAREELSALLRVKNLNLLPAKFGFDKNECLSDEIGTRQVFTAMAEAFHWDTTQLTWFLKSENILWMFSKGEKPTGDGIYFHENITKKTKIIGMLPFALFPDFVYDGAHGQCNMDLYGKPLWTPEEARSTSYSEHAPNGFDWSQKK